MSWAAVARQYLSETLTVGQPLVGHRVAVREEGLLNARDADVLVVSAVQIDHLEGVDAALGPHALQVGVQRHIALARRLRCLKHSPQVGR